jgi:hypothetical protein
LRLTSWRRKTGAIVNHLGVVLLLAVTALGQNAAQTDQGAKSNQQSAPPSRKTAADLASLVPTPRAEDVSSQEGLLGAIYEVISGPAGDRDWNRFRSLFLPQARLTRAGKNQDGVVTVNLMGVEDFIQLAGAAFKSDGFYEKAIVNRVQTFGNVAQVFSSYESRHAPAEKPFTRGINSMQLVNDGKRWWVLSILWDSERADNPLPPQFAKAKK